MVNTEFPTCFRKQKNELWTQHFPVINRLVKLPENKGFIAVVKAQLEKKATKPAKWKVSSLERKRFLAKRFSVISGSKKGKAPTERDQPTAKRSRKLSKQQLSTHLGTSEEDKQILTEQLTNAQDMAKTLRTENFSLKIKLQNIEQTWQNINKENKELKIAVKRLQQEKFSYFNLIKKPDTLKYLCGLSVEQFNILWNCVQLYSWKANRTLYRACNL